MNFPPVSDFPPRPYFRKIFRLRRKFPNFTFSHKIFRFSSAEISDDLFLVVDYKFGISPLFSLFQYISPYFGTIIISPLLLQISPLIS